MARQYTRPHACQLGLEPSWDEALPGAMFSADPEGSCHVVLRGNQWQVETHVLRGRVFNRVRGEGHGLEGELETGENGVMDVEPLVPSRVVAPAFFL